MSLKTIRCHLLVCDGCGETFENGEYIPHAIDDGEISDVREQANDCSDWTSNGTQDWCGGCKYKAHEPLPEWPGGDCARCGKPDDEHDDAPAVTR